MFLLDNFSDLKIAFKKNDDGYSAFVRSGCTSKEYGNTAHQLIERIRLIVVNWANGPLRNLKMTNHHVHQSYATHVLWSYLWIKERSTIIPVLLTD